jgi:hypothetical protein
MKWMDEDLQKARKFQNEWSRASVNGTVYNAEFQERSRRRNIKPDLNYRKQNEGNTHLSIGIYRIWYIADF